MVDNIDSMRVILIVNVILYLGNTDLMNTITVMYHITNVFIHPPHPLTHSLLILILIFIFTGMLKY